MAVVLVAVGLFVYLRFQSEQDNTVDQGLRSRAADLTVLLQRGDVGPGPPRAATLRATDEGFAQILDRRGNVVDAPPPFRRPLLTPDEVERAQSGEILVEHDVRDESGDVEPSRLLAAPAEADGQRWIVVAGTSLDDRHDALANLATELAVGGTIALVLASLAGYALAAAALRPVEAMRRRAAAITDAESGQRLPVPEAHDELSRLGHTLNDMLARLEAAFARERTFVADASHELRSPLAVLKAELELALRAGRTPEELRAALSSAAEETDRLAQLAEDLLVIARSDQGELPVRRTAVDSADVLAGVRERFARRSEAAGRELDADGVPGVALVADPARLQQALGNLVDNALRHGNGTVGMSAVERDGRVELHVTDEGPGFPPDFIPSAFERFTRGDPARGRGGAGLGLAIVDAIARAHGGRAHAENRPEGGADAWLELPREPQDLRR